MKIKEIHYYYPKKIITNKELDKTHPEWKVNKLFHLSGVKKRYVSSKNETSLGMAIKLINKILKKNKNFLSKVDGVIFCTQTPDYFLPSNSSVLQGIFNFNEITCRFIRIKLNGTSQNSNNYINKISLHHFNGRGNTLELNDAADIEVGNRIVFIQPQGDGCGEEYNPRIATAYRSQAQAGNIDNSNTVGGITTYYTVTAKTGNVITVDRPIEGKLLHYDTMVVKLDRAIQIYSESHIPFGPYGTNGNVDEQVSCELVNFTALSMGN